MGLPVIATLALSIVVIVIAKNSSGGQDFEFKAHHIIGFVLMGVVVIQFITGVVVYLTIYHKISRQSQFNMRWFHRVSYLYIIQEVFGYCIMILALINCILGFYILYPSAM